MERGTSGLMPGIQDALGLGTLDVETQAVSGWELVGNDDLMMGQTTVC